MPFWEAAVENNDRWFRLSAQAREYAPNTRRSMLLLDMRSPVSQLRQSLPNFPHLRRPLHPYWAPSGGGRDLGRQVGENQWAWIMKRTNSFGSLLPSFPEAEAVVAVKGRRA
jgi:hypothetical protein